MSTSTYYGSVATTGDNNDISSNEFHWTAVSILQSIVLFLLAGVAEIVGGWMVWMAVRGNDTGPKKPWWYAILGSMILIVYGFIPCFQPTSNFGRVYAVYGGVFIVLSYFFGYILDNDKPDRGDIMGASIALFGVCIAYFWPR